MSENPSSKGWIFVVDDEDDILELIRYNLSREGYRVSCLSSGKRVIEELRKSVPDLLLLDIMLPGVDGLEICRQVKSNPDTERLPVILITAKTEETDQIIGLEYGAADYITKPFSPRVLLARVKAVLRNQTQRQELSSPYLRFGDLAIHPGKHEVLIAEQRVDLTVTEFRILLTLARRPGWVFNREQIVDAARGTNTVVTSRSVDVHIVRLRSKLGVSGDLIETVRGIGYRFKRIQVDE